MHVVEQEHDVLVVGGDGVEEDGGDGARLPEALVAQRHVGIEAEAHRGGEGAREGWQFGVPGVQRDPHGREVGGLEPVDAEGGLAVAGGSGDEGGLHADRHVEERVQARPPDDVGAASRHRELGRGDALDVRRTAGGALHTWGL